MTRAARRGAVFYGVSPLRDDMPEASSARWLPIKVGTDVAMMLALAHTLLVENLWDRDFVVRYCTGFDVFERYLLGRDDNTPKDAAWAADIVGISAATIADLARRLTRGPHFDHGSRIRYSARNMASSRCGWARCSRRCWARSACPAAAIITRSVRSVTPAASRMASPIPTLPQGKNGVSDFIPVARISDMLLNPGQPFEI